MGDQLRLESVLTNFLTHAVKVSPTHSQIKVVIKMKVGRVMTLTSGKAESTASIPSLPPLSPLLGNTETGGQRVAGGGGSGAGGGSGTSKVVILHTNHQTNPGTMPNADTILFSHSINILCNALTTYSYFLNLYTINTHPFNVGDCIVFASRGSAKGQTRRICSER